MIGNTFITYFKNISASILIMCCFLQCKTNSSKRGISKATGWKIGGEYGGFYNTNFKEQEAAPGLVFIQGGTFTMGKTQDDPLHDWNTEPNQQHVQSFYIDESEVTNAMYLEYLYWLKKIFPPQQKEYKNIYKSALPDTLVWRNRLGYSESLTKNYLRHPAYGEYPVVGVSWVQAQLFCQWRTDRVNEYILVKDEYIKENSHYIDSLDATSTFNTQAYFITPTKAYGGNIVKMQGKRTYTAQDSTQLFVKATDGVLFPRYRLPTEVEWEYAAKALSGLREYNAIKGRKKYPWKGEFTRSGNRKNRADQLANFKQGKGDYGGVAGWSDDKADITAKIMSYPPNDFGLYDMAGNVSEWVADVYRPIVDGDANDFNYFRGNQYTKYKLDENKNVVLVTPESIQYDTLPNGKITPKNLPGFIVEIPIDENETFLRYNFDKADHRDFRDGEHTSTRYYDLPEESQYNPMYDAPQHKVTQDSLENIVKEYDKSEYRTTVIDNNIRVYKGGSWKDGAYWIDPAQRRAMPKYMAASHIGFRCAMSRIGAKMKTKKRKKG